MKGGSGDDTLVGGAGGDRLEAGSGDDVLRGGAGGDTFVFGSPTSSDVKTITDFDATEDKLLLSGGRAVQDVAIGGDVTLFHSDGGTTQTLVLEGVTSALADSLFLTIESGVVPTRSYVPPTLADSLTLTASDGTELFRYDGSVLKVAIDVEGVGTTTLSSELIESISDGSQFFVSDFTDWRGSGTRPTSAVLALGGRDSTAFSVDDDGADVIFTTGKAVDASSSTEDRFIYVSDAATSNSAIFTKGGSGDDFIYARGRISVEGGSGDDVIVIENTGAGNQSARGGAGDDVIHVLGGGTSLDGGAGDDTLYGGGGWDNLIGGDGDDVMYGGDGNDVFIFRSGESGTDTIKDFSTSDDAVNFIGGRVLQFIDGGTLTSRPHRRRRLPDGDFRGCVLVAPESRLPRRQRQTADSR